MMGVPLRRSASRSDMLLSPSTMSSTSSHTSANKSLKNYINLLVIVMCTYEWMLIKEALLHIPTRVTVVISDELDI
jgi:hypothetical protein